MKTLEKRALELLDTIEDGAETGRFGVHDARDELRELIRRLPEDVRMRIVVSKR